MKKKVALAFVGLLIIMIASFAPITTATWHGLPDVQSDHYVVTGGETVAKTVLWLGPLPIGPLVTPFVSRAPYLTPGALWQDINFSVAVDPTGGMLPGPALVFLTVPWQSIKNVEHIFFGSTLGYTRVKLLPIPGSDGVGWLYILPGIADVDIYVNNTYMPNPAPPPPDIPLAIWTSPSPTPGVIASPTGGPFDPFPSPGADTLPGFCPMGPGTQDDGFGDGVPDPAGSSVLFLPLQLSVEAWNGTAWVFQFGGPFILPMTTGTASDTAWPPMGLPLDGESVTYQGAPWEDVATTMMWGANENKRFVTYAYAWSFIQYFLSPGPPVVKLDLVYGGLEKKVKEPHVVADISCDGQVDITDIVIAALAFGSRDEGSLAPAGYDPTGEGDWPGPYPPMMPAPWLVVAKPNIAGVNFDARADLNNDGVIDICDLVAIAIDFGAAIYP